MAFYERQPIIYPLHQLILEVLQGNIKVPKFQRPGSEITWSTDQMGDLLDSIYRGFPIGTIMLWTGPKEYEISYFDYVGGYKIPEPNQNTSSRFLLDGHQRLSTLSLILGEGIVENLGEKIVSENNSINYNELSNWYFELDEKIHSNSRDRFTLLKIDQAPTKTQIPISIAINRAKLNKWIRSKNLTDNQTETADNLRDKIREYSLPVVALVSNSLAEAAESFKRINSSGTPMGDFHMVSALSYKSDFDLQKIFEINREKFFSEIPYWRNISDLDILRVCSSLINDKSQHPTKINIDNLAKGLYSNNLVIEKSFKSIKFAAEMLGKFGVHSPESLPYSWQLIVLAIAIGENREIISKEKQIEKWFWITTYGEVFAGINSAIYNRSKSALLEIISGKISIAIERDVSAKIKPITRFDFRAARSKACALAMARHQDNDNPNGKAHKALAEGVSSMQLFFSAGQRSLWWHLFIMEKHNVEEIKTLKNNLAKISKENNADTVEKIIKLIGPIGNFNKNKIDMETFISSRRKILLEKERDFVKKIGLTWAEK